MAKTWVLDTETKGTGAAVVPLDRRRKPDAPARNALYVPPAPAPRPAGQPEPRAPRSFRIVDVLSGAVLAEDADLRATLEVLAAAGSIVDVRVYVWMPDAERWRSLTMAELRALWARRER